VKFNSLNKVLELIHSIQKCKLFNCFYSTRYFAHGKYFSYSILGKLWLESNFVVTCVFDVLTDCKLTCHRKCYVKVKHQCGKDEQGKGGEGGDMAGKGGHVFGVPLARLAVGDGKVPVVVDRLITTIEMYGLYTEGLYRKSGVSSKVRELKSRIEEDFDQINLANYQVGHSDIACTYHHTQYNIHTDLKS
jgi:hypothetical protein